MLWVPCWSRDHLQGFQRVLDSFGSQEGLLESCAELFTSAFGEVTFHVCVSLRRRGQLVAIGK